MDLSILELVTLKEIPFPGELGGWATADHRHAITQRAAKRYDDMNTPPAVVLSVIDDLITKGYVERFSIGFCRRTHEGQMALKRNVRHLQELVALLAI